MRGFTCYGVPVGEKRYYVREKLFDRATEIVKVQPRLLSCWGVKSRLCGPVSCSPSVRGLTTGFSSVGLVTFSR